MILYYVKVIEYEFIVSPTDFSAKQNKKGGGRYFNKKTFNCVLKWSEQRITIKRDEVDVIYSLIV